MEDQSNERDLGFNVSCLEKGTKIRACTANSVYEFDVVEGKNLLATGGSTSEGSARYEKPTPINFHGSKGRGSVLKVDWIGKDMKMEFFVDDNLQTVVTSPVVDVELIGPEGKWKYQMEWNDE